MHPKCFRRRQVDRERGQPQFRAELSGQRLGRGHLYASVLTAGEGQGHPVDLAAHGPETAGGDGDRDGRAVQQPVGDAADSDLLDAPHGRADHDDAGVVFFGGLDNPVAIERASILVNCTPTSFGTSSRACASAASANSST